eukprot:gene13246-28042_t
MSFQLRICCILCILLFIAAFRSLPSKCHQHLKIISLLELHDSRYTSVMIVPTGIGASIGGYAGDALPTARLLSSIVDTLITHPNVMNGAMLYWPMANVMYVEGWALDEFASGRIGLLEMSKKGHKIGLLLDSAIEHDLRIRHLQAADGARATLGLNIAECVITPRPVGVDVKLTPSGASWGSVNDLDALVEGAQELIRKGCTAIAVVVRFPEDDEEAAALFESYRRGVGVDAIAGAEALISHVITKRLLACAEELGYTFLPCVLAYLHRAPSLVNLMGDIDRSSMTTTTRTSRGMMPITNAAVDSVVVPASALGGSAVLSFISQGKLIVVVEENATVMEADVNSLKLSGENIVVVRSYAEAAGILAAHKAGILLEAITSKVSPIRITDLSSLETHSRN